MDWFRNLRIVLTQEKKEYVPHPEELEVVGHNTAQYRQYVKHNDDAINVQCLMLACMSPELQKQFESANPHNMIVRLKGMFENQARVDRFWTSKALFGSRLADGEPVSPHLINMIGHVESLV
jgi:hypothetical protein